MKKIIIIGTKGREAIFNLIRGFVPLMERYVKILDIDCEEKLYLDKVKCDFIVVFGGDGTILNTARRMKKNQIPVLGVNAGRIGFLAEVKPEEFEEKFKWVLKGKYLISHRIMLEGMVYQNSKLLYKNIALNDITICRDSLSRMFSVNVYLKDTFLSCYKGDGIIVSTPTGSTAYSFSAGGPIVEVEMNTFILSPICPHTLSNRPFIISGNNILNLVPIFEDIKIILTFDGQEYFILEKDSKITVRRFSKKFKLIEFSTQSQYISLREKLGWGK